MRNIRSKVERQVELAREARQLKNPDLKKQRIEAWKDTHRNN